MSKSFKSFSCRAVSVLLAVMLLVSTCAVGIVTTSAVETKTVVPQEGSRLLFAVTSGESDVYCYWWNNSDSNGFVRDDEPKEKGENTFWTFSIPDDAVGVILTKKDEWDEESENDNADIKLTGKLAVGADMSAQIFLDLTEEAPSLTDFAQTTLKIREQDKENRPVVKPNENIDLVSFADFQINGSAAKYIDEISVYDNDIFLQTLQKDNTFSFSSEELGKHVFSFFAEDPFGNIVKAGNRYTVYCKAERGELEFNGETPVTMVYGSGATEPLGIIGLDKNDRVEYSSDDESVVRIADGKIEAVAPGNTKIVATVAESSKYYSATASYDIEVVRGDGKDYVSFKHNVNPETPVEITYGETYSNPVEFDKDENPNADIHYSSDNPEIAWVDANGTVTAAAASDTVVTITVTVTNLHNLSDVELYYTVIVKKADYDIPEENINSEKTTYKPDLKVDCSDNVKVPIGSYTASYEISSMKSLEKEPITSGAVIDENGMLSVTRSGVFTISETISSANYNEKIVSFTVTVNRAERKNFSYVDNNINMYVGCSKDIVPPESYSDVKFSMKYKYKEFARLEGNKLTALKESSEPVVITVRIDSDECYRSAKTELNVNIRYFVPRESPLFTFEGTPVAEGDTSRFVSDVVIKPNGEYKIALYDEEAENNTELVFEDQLPLTDNTSNPRVVLKCVKADLGLNGAISDVIDTGISIDKTQPKGEIKAVGAFKRTFETLLDMITFGLYTPSCEYEIDASDSESEVYESGVTDVKYFIEREAVEGADKTVSDLDALEADKWTDYTGKFQITNENSRLVIYARLADAFGNVKYICTDGTVFDKESPKVTLTFDNNESLNKGYFNKPRTAVIEVEEENFIPTDGMIIITAKNASGEEIEAPEITWDETNRKAVIVFDRDGVYDFDTTGLVDKAGNKRTMIYTDGTKNAKHFVIDQIAPEVVVSYNNNSVSGGENRYFDDYRTAQIVVTDDNFEGRASMIKVTAKTPDGTDTEPPAVRWDEETHKNATINYSEEGTYWFTDTKSFMDLAGNKANVKFAEGTVSGDKFIIDKTKPVVELSFKNNNSKNGVFNYARIATVKITDYNLRSDDNMFTITAEPNGDGEVSAPEIEWDGNTATIVFDQNAHYTFNVNENLHDLAGNPFDSVLVEEGTEYPNDFTIDLIAPKATLTYDNNDVANERYFAQGRTATITVEDDCFEGTPEMFTVTARNAEGEMESPQVSWNGNIGTLEFTEDGIYTIEPNDSFTDLAGSLAELDYDHEITKAPFEFVIDQTSPVVTVVITPPVSTADECSDIPREVSITVEDDNFAAEGDMLEVTTDHYTEESALPSSVAGGKGFSVRFPGDAAYVLKLTDSFRDFAGNKYTMAIGSADYYSFCVDRSAPDLEIKYKHSKSGLVGTFQSLVEFFTFGIVYFPDEVTVEITASDPHSGIDRIDYSVPIETQAAGLGDGATLDEATEDEATGDEASADGNYTKVVKFRIPAEYEGKVNAVAYNNANLYTESDEGVIRVGDTQKNPRITLEIINEKQPRRYDDKDYYKEDVKLRVRVEDTFFDAKGSVKEYLKDRDNLIIAETTNGGAPVYFDPCDYEWIREDEGTNWYYTDITLNTEGDKRIDVSYRNNFGVEAESAVLEDFVIDKTAPTATITYDNNYVVNEKFYKDPRVATITVDDSNFEFTERSFDQSEGNKNNIMWRFKTTNIKGDKLEKDKYKNVVPKAEIGYDKKTATVTFAGDGMYKIESTAKFTDKAGNAVVLDDTGAQNPYEFGVDKTEPDYLTITYNYGGIKYTLEQLKKLFLGDFIYLTGAVEVTIRAKDVHSGINRIEYTGTTDEDPETMVSCVKSNESGSYEQVVTFNAPKEFIGKIEATAYNNAERYAATTDDGVAISEKKPEIKLEIINEQEPKKHKEKQGDEEKTVSYYNKDVKVRVTITDIFFDSVGARKGEDDNPIANLEVTETTDGSETEPVAEVDDWAPADNSNSYYRDYLLSAEGAKEFLVEYTNNAGLSADSQMLSDFVIDKTKPEVTISFDNNSAKNSKYFNSARKATVKVEDRYFNGEDEMLSVSGRNKADSVEINWNWINSHEAVLNFTEDAFYTFNINSDNFMDLAGNEPNVTCVEGTVAPYDFVVDTKAPNKLTIDVKETDTGQTVYKKFLTETTAYSPKDTSHNVYVTLTADDELMNASDLKLEYSITSSDSVVEKTEYNSPIQLSPNRHFVVTAYVEDKAGNKVHIMSQRITLDRNAPEIDGLSPTIELDASSAKPITDVSGGILYNDDVVIRYTVTDPILNNSCSGLEEGMLKYSIYSDGLLTEKGDLSGSRTEFGGRLQKLSGTIRVDSNRNDSNNVEVVVEVQDQAENTAKDSAKLRIDRTEPVINISYDNNTPDSSYTEFFKDARVATISITERNFNGDKVVIKATKNDADYNPSLSWTHSGTPDTDNYVHTATINYSEDADYTFDISYTDEAGNAAATGSSIYGNSVSPTKFTVDRTAPVITVTFDPNNPVQGNYFNKTRVATVTVTEHNFDSTRVSIPITATENGKSVTPPTISGWSSNGDVHTATITFSSDALYGMTPTVTDKAGNKTDADKVDNFQIDTTKPVIHLNRVKNYSANPQKEDNGQSSDSADVGFEVTVEDNHIDFNKGQTFTLERIDMNATYNKEKKAYKGFLDLNKDVETKAGSTKKSFFIDNLKDDGIYRITCTFTDSAGNVTSTKEVIGTDNKAIGTDEIMFSVNREGSTFRVDDDTLKSIETGYVQNISKDIVITEINPNEIEKRSVSLTINDGELKVLGNDNYKFEQVEDNKLLWKQYTYTVKANNFEDEAAYALKIVSTDKAENNSYSDTANPAYSGVKNSDLKFVVDRTIPEVVVNNLEDGGHYNVDKKTVEIIANDDNSLKKVSITLNGEEVAAYNEDQLEENVGKMSLEIKSSESFQNLKIEAVDAANNSTEDKKETQVHFKDFLITTNLFIQFINKPILVLSTIVGALLIAAAIVFLVIRKKGKAGI